MREGHRDDERDEIDDSTAPLMEHLAELRTRLITSVVAFAVAMIAAFAVAGPIFNFLASPLARLLIEHGQKPELIYTGLQQGFFTQVRISVFGGFILAFPVIGYQLWRFVAPGLYKHEKKWVAPFVFVSAGFFILGGWFGYAVAFPMVAKFLVTAGEDFQPVLKIDDYLDILSKILLGMGLVFETPIFIFFLARIGVVTEKWLLLKFRYAVLVIFIIAALITPTPDIPTQCAFAFPMIALYLLGILLAWAFKKKEPKEEGPGAA